MTNPALVNYNYESSNLSTVRLNKETNFIPAQELLAEVRNFLGTYMERALLDDSVFYPKIRSCLAKCGAKIYPIGSTMVPVKDYKAEIPTDFHKLVVAIGCFDYTSTNFNENPQLHDVPESEITNFLITKPSYTCLDECGENFYVIQKYETFSVTYTDYAALRVSKNSWPKCSNGCFNKHTLSDNQIEIGDKYITATFATGWIYLEYLQNLESQDQDLIIPDYAQVRDWIKAACISEGLYYLLLQGNSVERILAKAEQKETGLESNARTFIKQNEFKELYDVRKLFFGRYKKYSDVIYGYK